MIAANGKRCEGRGPEVNNGHSLKRVCENVTRKGQRVRLGRKKIRDGERKLYPRLPTL
jgi:hypothetical protein